MKIDLELEQSEFNTIIAALRHWEKEMLNAEMSDDWSAIDDYEEILLDGMDHIGPDAAFLDSQEIGYLTEFINCE